MPQNFINIGLFYLEKNYIRTDALKDFLNSKFLKPLYLINILRLKCRNLFK